MSIESWTAENGFRWEHVKLDEAGRAWLVAQGLDRLAFEALVAEDTRPRVSVLDSGAVAVLRGVNLTEGAEPEDMISARIWLEETRVITVWLRPLRAMGKLRDAANAGTIPSSAGEFVSRLALGLGETASPVISGLGDQVDTLEEALFDTEARVNRAALSDLRRVVIMLRRYFAPQALATKELRAIPASWVGPRDRQRLGEAADRMVRVTEELEALGQRAQVVQDHMSAQQADHMNRQMFVMSIAAALFLPLGFLTGLMGINVGGMPGVDAPWAFWAFCAVLVVVGIGQWWVFRRMGVVGSARRSQ